MEAIAVFGGLGLPLFCGTGSVSLLMFGGLFDLSCRYLQGRDAQLEVLARERGWRLQPGGGVLLLGPLLNGQSWRLRQTFSTLQQKSNTPPST